MYKYFTRSFLLISVVALISSCAAFHTGYMSSSASLSSPNFSYVKQNVKGVSTATYIFGIGGMSKETLVDNAKQELLTANPLGNNQALANLTVNFKSSFYLGLLYRTVKCTVAADVVEFK